MPLRCVCLAAGFTLGLGLSSQASVHNLPDLEIARVSVDTTDACRKGKSEIIANVVIRNNGPARGQIFTTRDMVRATFAEDPSIRSRAKFVNSMRVGEEQTVELRFLIAKTRPASGRQTITLTVDPLAVFRESDETNNTTSVTFDLPSCPPS